ncbi:MAG: hypothetical protein E7612_06575 [Ruminococcaceae bacterium]|nr:hypothetical protein [Oscillospiraceae bacterium]
MMKYKRFLTFFLCLALMITIGGEFFSALGIKASAAEAVTYSNVLDDLSKDSSFNPADYPAKADDYSLQVIQIAEGTNGELFVYVYQPSENTSGIVATKVLMSNTGTNDGLDFYDLDLVSAEGVFYKYLIKGLTRKEEYTRKYLIISIFRPWNDDYGDSTQEGTIGSEKAYPVELIFTYETSIDGTITISAEYTEDIITVIDECAGEIYYDNATPSGQTGYLSHYYAFSTNKPIDSIYKAYIDFDYDYHYYLHTGGLSQPTKIDEQRSESVEITKDEIINLPSGSFWFVFWGKYSYDYPRINSTKDFLAQEGTDLTDQSKNAISQQQWIFRYYESDYNSSYLSTSTMEEWSHVTDIRMFRLIYEYNGQIYDVGVVADVVGEDNVSDGSGKPTYIWEGWKKDFEDVMKFLMIIAIFLLFSFLSGPLGFILKIIYEGVTFLLSLVLKILLFPFKFFVWLLKKNE